MQKIRVLDCTLRDGGYCNNWEFGYTNIKSIITGLVNANIDIVECGFLTNKTTHILDITKFANLEEISSVLPLDRNGKTYVAMINYGEYDIESLPKYNGTSVDGIRIAFHKKNMDNALKLCKTIKEKGYKVFVQAMLSMSYNDTEFIDLIHKVNEIGVYAFYIVDSFGMMKSNDLIHLFYLTEYNLCKDIYIGFHSHNNLQMSYSNAQKLIEIQTKHNLIIDSSVYGMGRGAGNLNTELLVEYLNDNKETNYHLKPLLTIIDEILNEFYQRNYWGYSLSNYLSAVHNAHPNYARYLDDKKTLTIEGMNEIFNIMDCEKKYSYDKDYIEKIYLEYMENNKIWDEYIPELKDTFIGKKVLVIAPGKSSITEKDKIISFASQKDVITISVNFEYEYVKTDFVFFSNIRRFRELDPKIREKCIITSNIPAYDVYFRTNYRDLLTEEESVIDNAGLMSIKFLINCGVLEIYLAGFDGYTYNIKENYGDLKMAFSARNDVLNEINLGMSKVLKMYAKKAQLAFVTKPKYIMI